MAMAKIFVVLFVVLLAMAERSMQVNLKNPVRMPGSGIVGQAGSSLGLIVSSTTAEKALNDSGLFIPSKSVNLFGRKFITGTIYGLDVVYVRSASTPSVHVGMTVQIMCENFKIQGIVHYGSAGATNETLNIGDVVVPSFYKFTGAWEWLSKDSNTVGDLNIGDFNYPVNGKNLLGSLLYAKELDVYNGGREFELPNDLFVSTPWLNLAISADIQIDGYEVVYGLNASSSDIYVSNPAYREFLFDQLSCATADTSGAAFILAALSNSNGYIVFQGISNLAGAGSGVYNSTLANENAFSAVAQFIKYIATPPALHRLSL